MFSSIYNTTTVSELSKINHSLHLLLKDKFHEIKKETSNLVMKLA